MTDPKDLSDAELEAVLDLRALELLTVEARDVRRNAMERIRDLKAERQVREWFRNRTGIGAAVSS